MHIIETLYLLASFVSILAMAPQIKQLFVTKRSDELSLTTWLVWSSYQCIALAYAIALHLVIYSIVNVSWVLFYGVMITMIIRYRKNTLPANTVAVQENVVETKNS